jgi:hypothetical protein
MRRIILFLTVLAATASCTLLAADAPKRQGWSGFPLYGNVKSVTRTELKVSSGVVVRDKINSKTSYNFNEAGDVTEEATYMSDGSLKGTVIFKYDAKGNKTEDVRYGSAGSLSGKTTYKYDFQGNVSEITEYDGEMRLVSQFVFTITYRK